MNRVVIVTINWNGAEDTAECVASLRKLNYENFHIVVVDNNSTAEGTHEALDALAGDDVTVIYNEANLGFSGGVNTGIRYAMERDYSYVALFNNDAIADKNWLKELVKAAEKEKSGITTGLLLHRDGKTIDSTGDWCSNWGLPFPRNRGDKVSEAARSGYVFSGSGGASLYSVKMFEEIGLFDEKYFMYYEDTDMSFRAQNYGYSVYYTDQAIAYHKQGASSDKVSGLGVKQAFRNLPTFYIKNMPAGLLLSTGPRFLLAYILIFGNALVRGNSSPAIRGLLSGIPLFWLHALPSRKKIQRERKATTKDIGARLWPDLPPDQTGLRKFRSVFTGKK